MKLIEINIGLSSKTLGNLNPNEVLNSLTGRGFNLITYRVQESVCKDGEERCLAVKVEAPEDWQVQLRVLSDRYGQDCIAVVGFIGHSPYDAFVPSLWVEPAKVELSPCEAIQAKHRAKARGEDADEFIAYLLGTLIPDLQESGWDSTAEDFQTLIDFYRNK